MSEIEQTKDFKFRKVENLLKAYETGCVPPGRYQVQIKLDGANTGIIRLEDSLVVHSRNNILAKLTKGNDQNVGGLNGFVEFVKLHFNHFFDNLAVGDHVYAEWLTPHTITYPADMYKCLYIFDDNYQHLVDADKRILSTPRLGFIDIATFIDEDGKKLVERVMELTDQYVKSLDYKTEGVVLTRLNADQSYTPKADRFKVIFPEFREDKKVAWTPTVNDNPVEIRLAAEYSIRSYEKILEKVKDIKSVDSLTHKDIPTVLGLAWHDYMTEFFVDCVNKYKYPEVRFKALKSEFDKRIRELTLTLLNTGQLPQWALHQQVREHG